MLVLIPSRLEAERLLPEADCGPEPRPWPGRRAAGGGELLVATCGVGAAVAGLRASRLLSSVAPERAVLAGLAGSLDAEALPPGTTCAPDRVELHGVGVGEGSGHLGLADCGGPLAAEAADASGALSLAAPAPARAVRVPLLTVCAASASLEEAATRRARHPACLAEDMESWSVARAAQLSGVSLLVLRGISNVAGERDLGRWELDRAFALLRGSLEAVTEPSS